MPKLIPAAERNPMNHCWFCGTNKSVKYTGSILNPCPWASNRYLDILMCNKCATWHAHHLAEFWLEKARERDEQ